jgi:hypothetical protein
LFELLAGKARAEAKENKKESNIFMLHELKITAPVLK